MSEIATIGDLKSLENRMNKRFDDLFEVLSKFADDVHSKLAEHDRRFEEIDKRFDEIDIRFEQIDRRFDEIDKRFEEHDARFDQLDGKYDHLINTVDGIAGKIEDHEIEYAARDHILNRHDNWIQKISRKTGVKLT